MKENLGFLSKTWVVTFIRTWVLRSTPFKISKLELEENPNSVWKEELYITNYGNKE